MENLKIILPLAVVVCLCIWVVRRVIADEKGTTPIVVPKAMFALGKESWFTRIAVGLGAAVSMWSLYQRDHKSLGFIFLFGSILTIIAGFTTLVSKRTRQRARAITLATEPYPAASFDSSEAEKKAQRRGYIILLIGVVMFLTWSVFYGFSSLAVGV